MWGWGFYGRIGSSSGGGEGGGVSQAYVDNALAGKADASALTELESTVATKVSSDEIGPLVDAAAPAAVDAALTALDLPNTYETVDAHSEDVQQWVLPRFIGVATIADLATIAQQTGDGDRVFVLSVRDTFVKRLNPTGVTDGISLVADALNADYKWERLNVPHPSWMRQSAWYLSPATGNDENTGNTSGTAIKTPAELVRRLGRTWRTLEQYTTIYILDDLPDDDSLQLYLSLSIKTGQACGAAIVGTLQAAQATGVLTSFSALSRATNTPNRVTANGITWANYIGCHLRITSGTRNGYSAPIVATSGGTLAELGSFCAPPTVAEASGFGTPTLVTDLAGTETFEILRPTKVGARPRFSFRPANLKGGAITQQDTVTVTMSDCWVNGGSSTQNALLSSCWELLEPGVVGWIQRCLLGSLVFGAGLTRIVNCVHMGGVITGPGASGQAPRFIAGAFVKLGGTQGTNGPVQVVGANVCFDGDIIFQNSPLLVGQASGQSNGWPATVTLGNVCLRQNLAPGPGMVLHPNSRARVQNGLFGSHVVWGAGNTYGLQIQSGALLTYDATKPSVTGSTGDAIVAGSARTYASTVPYSDTTNFAGLIQTAG